MALHQTRLHKVHRQQPRVRDHKISDSGEALAHYMFVYLESTFRPEIVVLPDVTRARRILNEIKGSIV